VVTSVFSSVFVLRGIWTFNPFGWLASILLALRLFAP
jgi:hypothetical protein